MKKKLNNVSEIKELLAYDSLAMAEQFTGNSYKDDEKTGMLGMLLNIDKSNKLKSLLNANDDTTFSETTENYLRKVTDFGFRTILKEDFQSDGWNDEKITESLFVMWHDEFSILLCFDTFRGKRNGGKFYYNWSPNNDINRHSYTSSGTFIGFCYKDGFKETLPFSEPEPKWDDVSWEDFKVIQSAWRVRYNEHITSNNLRSVWSGDHDCREALKLNISQLAENGKFLTNWINTPFLWLLHHGDTKTEGYSYEAINKERIAKLPVDVQEKIGFKK